jgi:hypothetical protein
VGLRDTKGEIEFVKKLNDFNRQEEDEYESEYKNKKQKTKHHQ